MWNLQALTIKVCFLRSLRKRCGRRRKRRFFDDRNLWTISRTAAYLGYSPRYFKRSIATLKGFPEPIVLPTAARGGDERYEPKEVKEWARRQRK